jgi:dTMP kinase
MVPDLEFSGPRPDSSAPVSPPVRRPGGRLRTVALVGIDGSGKTTQAHLLATALADRGLPASYRRNAGGRRWFGRLASAVGRRDGEHLLGRKGMLLVESVLRWLSIVRTLLRRKVTGEVAVMDRYAVCQYASIRAHAKNPSPTAPPPPLTGLKAAIPEKLNRAERRARLAYRIFPKPDVTFLLAVDPAVAYDRIERRGYDHEEMSYLHAASAAYRALPEYPEFVVIDANGTPEEISAALLAHLRAWAPRPRPVPLPRLPVESRGPAAVLVSHARALMVVAVTLAAAASALTYQLAEGF